MSAEAIPKKHASARSKITSEEANLIWDEYKYRHDLIWRLLIRSTVAVIALITVSYSTNFEENKALFIIAALLAVVYTVFNSVVLNSELVLYERVKALHRQRQNDLYQLHREEDAFRKGLGSGFSTRARIYLAGLFVLALAAAVSHIF
jgi:hypothetical protein